MEVLDRDRLEGGLMTQVASIGDPAINAGALVRQRVLFASVFVSGMAALLYQIAWVRALVPVIGLDFFAVSSVATGTLVGLGIGSYLFGAVSDWSRRKLLVYLALEVLIPLTSVALLFWVRANVPWINELVRSSDSAAGTMLLQFLFGGVTTMIPSVFMGGTLPALIGYFYSGKRDADNTIALIYAVNTAGSVASALALSWLLIGLYGVTNTFLIAATFNLASALLVVYLGWRAPAHAGGVLAASPTSLGAAATDGPGWRMTDVLRLRLLAAYFLVGFVGLGFQQVIYRLTTFYWGGGTAQYSFVIGFFLLGLVIGAILTYRAEQQSIRFGVNEASLVFLARTGALAMLISPVIVAAAVRWVRTSEAFYARVATADGPALALNVGYQFGIWSIAGLAAIAIPTALSGAIYPIINHALASNQDRAGHWTGLTLLVGLTGSLFGGLLTTYVLLSWLDFWATLVLLAALLVLSGELVRTERGSALQKRPSLVMAGEAAAVVTAVAYALVPGPSALGLLSGQRVLDMEKGITGLAHLTASESQGSDQASVYINAKSQGSLGRTPASQVRTMFAKALVPDANRILLIGLGDGANLHFLSRYFPDAEITVVEINREITPLIERSAFADSPKGAGARVRLLQDDGRFLMNRDATTYDLVVTNPVRSADEYSSFLYSVEFFQLVHSRLTEKGAFVGMYSPYAPIMGALIGDTVRLVFPSAARAAAGNLIVATKSREGLLSGEANTAAMKAKVCGQPGPQGAADPNMEPCERVVSALTVIAAPGPGARVVRDDRPFNEFYFLLR